MITNPDLVGANYVTKKEKKNVLRVTLRQADEK